MTRSSLLLIGILTLFVTSCAPADAVLAGRATHHSVSTKTAKSADLSKVDCKDSSAKLEAIARNVRALREEVDSAIDEGRLGTPGVNKAPASPTPAIKSATAPLPSSPSSVA